MSNMEQRGPGERQADTFLSARFGGNYAPLAIALVLVYALAPVLATGFVAQRILGLVFFAAVLLGLRGATSSRIILIAAASLVLLSLLLSSAGSYLDNDPLESAAAFLNLGFLALLPVFLLRDVLSHRRVTVDTILGALCVYFLVAFFLAFLFLRIAIMDSTAFSIGRAIEIEPGQLDLLPDFLYFSFVTITTLGYGDITPATGLTRSLATLEALIGQSYLIVLVARLVALQLAHSDR